MISLDRYAAVHASPQGASDARPTATQVLLDQNLLGLHLTHKIILITGGTAGIGASSAQALHQTGAKIFITGRDVSKGMRVAQEISSANPSYPPVEMIEMDQASLESVRRAADEFLQRSGGRCHVLMLNAGVVGCPKAKTVDGYEIVFATNHLAHFLLFHLLRNALEGVVTPGAGTRVVVVASAGHRAGCYDPEDYNMERLGENVSYDPGVAYARSKTANIHFANEVERRYGGRGVHALSLNPGLIFNTEIGRDMPESWESIRESYIAMDPMIAKYERSIEQGAATQVWASVAKELEGKGGLYLDDVQIAKEAEDGPPRLHLPGWKPWIWDQEMAAKLWEDSLKMVGLPGEE